MALSNPENKMPVTDKIPPAAPAKQTAEQRSTQFLSVPSSPGQPSADDGTRALLQAGFWIMLAGLLALLATKTVLGGIGIDGPHTNTGWLAFMFALMGVPFGLMLLVLGVAKWLRNHHMNRPSA